jgi:hypothetical protein
MTTLLATLVVVGGVMALMAVGAVVQGRRLRGSCGQGADCACDALTARSCPRRRGSEGSGEG